jgi:hypothetical protein
MSEHRTVLVESISYLGTDGVDHVAYRGDKITVAAAGVANFDFIHNDTPEYRAAEQEKRNAELEKAAKAAPKAEPAAKKV